MLRHASTTPSLWFRLLMSHTWKMGSVAKDTRSGGQNASFREPGAEAFIVPLMAKLIHFISPNYADCLTGKMM
jgi:hypothetical protein